MTRRKPPLAAPWAATCKTRPSTTVRTEALPNSKQFARRQDRRVDLSILAARYSCCDSGPYSGSGPAWFPSSEV